MIKKDSVVKFLNKYGNYSTQVNGIVRDIVHDIKENKDKVLIEYVFWGPYDDDPQKYKEWHNIETLEEIVDENKIKEVIEKINNIN